MKPRKKPLPRSGKCIRSRKADPAKRRWAKHRDPEYELWIEDQPCLICHRRPVDPAHLTHRSRGGDDRNNLVPLCRTHHEEQEGRTAAFEERYHLDLRVIAILLTEQYATQIDAAF